MQDAQTQIADKVRGIAAEKRLDQEAIAGILRLSRQSVNLRFNGRVPFTATEIYTLAAELNVEITRFFPAVPVRLEAVAS